MKPRLLVLALLSAALATGQTITTRPPAGIGGGGGCAGPTAAFSADNLTPTTAELVTFTDASTIESAPCDSALTDWLWDFGDGDTSLLQSPTHTYALAGTYTVRLEARSLLGADVERKVDYIEVSEP